MSRLDETRASLAPAHQFDSNKCKMVHICIVTWHDVLIVVQTQRFEHHIHNTQRIKRKRHVLMNSNEILLKSLVLNPTKPTMTLNDT